MREFFTESSKSASDVRRCGDSHPIGVTVRGTAHAQICSTHLRRGAHQRVPERLREVGQDHAGVLPLRRSRRRRRCDRRWGGTAADRNGDDDPGAGRSQGRRRGHDRRTVRRDERDARWLLPPRLQGPRRGDQLGRADSWRVARQGRGAPGHRLRRRELIDPLDEIIRIEGGQVLATLIRLTGDIDRAEDALHDAIVVAADVWRRDGPPDKPGAWLTTVARNKALDRLRREAKRQPKEAEAFRLLTETSTGEDAEGDNRDDRLRLLFTCCHPALSPEAQVALALRTICGLTTVDIARIFVVPEPTIGQRISRAKAKIANAHIPYRVPEAHELPDRLRPVLATIYAVFTAGHHAPVGELDARVDLADEAIRLSRVLVELMPDEGECVGLLALTLATNARRSARIDSEGEIVLLADQDRSLWDDAAIREASALVESVLRRGRPGAYQIQAAIACLHGSARTYADTDLAQIAELYGLLEKRWPTPIVRVNRAVAVAEVDGPLAGLDLLAEIEGTPIERWHLYWTARADFQRRLGDLGGAAESYRSALDCPSNDSDRRLLRRRLSEVQADADAEGAVGPKRVTSAKVRGTPADDWAMERRIDAVAPAAD